jgi:hypothetical protein
VLQGIISTRVVGGGYGLKYHACQQSILDGCTRNPLGFWKRGNVLCVPHVRHVCMLSCTAGCWDSTTQVGGVSCTNGVKGVPGVYIQCAELALESVILLRTTAWLCHSFGLLAGSTCRSSVTSCVGVWGVFICLTCLHTPFSTDTILTCRLPLYAAFCCCSTEHNPVPYSVCCVHHVGLAVVVCT